MRLGFLPPSEMETSCLLEVNGEGEKKEISFHPDDSMARAVTFTETERWGCRLGMWSVCPHACVCVCLCVYERRKGEENGERFTGAAARPSPKVSACQGTLCSETTDAW